MLKNIFAWGQSKTARRGEMQVCGRLWVVISDKVRCAKAAVRSAADKEKAPDLDPTAS